MSLFLVFSILSIINIAIQAILAILVYKDAKKRDMDAAIWVIIVLFTPIYIGFIIYLVISRSNHPIASNKILCTMCNTYNDNNALYCKGCGHKL